MRIGRLPCLVFGCASRAALVPGVRQRNPTVKIMLKYKEKRMAPTAAAKKGPLESSESFRKWSHAAPVLSVSSVRVLGSESSAELHLWIFTDVPLNIHKSAARQRSFIHPSRWSTCERTWRQRRPRAAVHASHARNASSICSASSPGSPHPRALSSLP